MADYTSLALDRQFCFLVYRLDRAIQQTYRPLLSRLGLTYPQYVAMLALWDHDGASIGDLCTALRLDTGTVSPLVQRLEAAGLVERRRDSTDERRVSIHLSPRGWALRDEARSVPETIARCLLPPAQPGVGPSSPEAAHQVWESLEALAQRLEGGECPDPDLE